MAFSRQNLFDIFEEFVADGSDFEPDSDNEETLFDAFTDNNVGYISSSEEETCNEAGPSSQAPTSRPVRGRGKGKTCAKGPQGAVKGKKKQPLRHWEDDEGHEIEWTDDLECFPIHCPFTGMPGLHTPDNIRTPLDFFNFTWTKDLIKFIKAETNKYAKEQLSNRAPLACNSRFIDWKNVTINELYKFFAILVHMGLMKKPSLNDYWSTNEILRCSFASSLMSRNRFLAILSCLHLCDNVNYKKPGMVGHDPLFKIRYLYDHLRSLYKSLYTPKANVSIDEAMCPWKGNIRYRVYMKDKPHKWGIKFYEICESDSGYVYDFEIYCGDPQISNRPVEVCKRLMTPLLNKGYTLFTDNYYTCPELSFAMAEQQTMTVGTVRGNRVGMPKDLQTLQLTTGDVVYRRKGPLAALKWKDKKDVFMLTTVHNPQQMQSVTTRSGTKDKPTCVQSYIHHMAGVDHSDQLLSYIPLKRRTSKCWKKLFMHLFTLNLIQCSILFNKKQSMNKASTVKLPEFLKQLGQALAAFSVEKTCAAAPSPSPSSSHFVIPASPSTPTTVARLKDRHFPYPLPPTKGNLKPRRACKVCSVIKRKAEQPDGDKTNKRTETYFWCPDCQVPLCIGDCFKLFHTRMNYDI